MEHSTPHGALRTDGGVCLGQGEIRWEKTVSTHTHTHIYIYTYVYKPTQSVYIYICICMYISIYAYVCICEPENEQPWKIGGVIIDTSLPAR